jgi:D-alanine-D-alanine ligase
MMENKKINVAIIYGGQSAEHGISTISAFHIANALDKNKYTILPIGITEQGEWYLQPSLLHDNKTLDLVTNEQYHLPSLRNLSQETSVRFPKIDVAFPILHGPFGEDGTIQGLLKLANIPFVGCDVASSAICMDKDIMKRLLIQANILTTDYLALHRHELNTIALDDIIQRIHLPCFVKPANMGSSIGISKVSQSSELLDAIHYAFEYDRKVLVEANITGREIECAVLGNETPIVSIPGEIIPQHDFYSYQAKYFDENGARLIIPAILNPQTLENIQKIALRAFKTLDCQGMARVDFFVDQQEKIYINELNTIPGFTTISMYPKLWEASGIRYTELLDRLIQLAIQRFTAQQSLRLTAR